MGLVGVSLVLAARQAFPPSRRWRRVAVIAACALAVSAASYAMFPQTWIRFGILHAIALSSVIAWPLGASAAGARARPRDRRGRECSSRIRRSTIPRCSGSASPPCLPRTEDYVPLFPWLGVTLIGIALRRRAPRDAGSAHCVPLANAPASSLSGDSTASRSTFHQAPADRRGWRSR
jgi:uncharacterized membrane protein